MVMKIAPRPLLPPSPYISTTADFSPTKPTFVNLPSPPSSSTTKRKHFSAPRSSPTREGAWGPLRLSKDSDELGGDRGEHNDTGEEGGNKHDGIGGKEGGRCTGASLIKHFCLLKIRKITKGQKLENKKK